MPLVVGFVAFLVTSYEFFLLASFLSCQKPQPGSAGSEGSPPEQVSIPARQL